MSYSEKKITQAEIDARNVKSAPDVLVGNAGDNKQVFDTLPEYIVEKYNSLMDDLDGTQGDIDADISSIGSEIDAINETLATKADNVDFAGATATEASEHGLVPPLAAGRGNDLLFGDGDWDQLDVDVWQDGSTVKVGLVKGSTPYSEASIPSATTTKSGAMSATDKNKLDNIASGAEVNVQSDWNDTDTFSDAYIKNKPTIVTPTDLTAEQTARQQADNTLGGQVADLKSDLSNLITDATFTESDGYFTDSGNIQVPTESGEKYTSKIAVKAGETVEVTQTISASRGLWIAYCLYNESENIVGYRETLLIQTATKVNGSLVIPDGISYIAFCFRTYGLTTSFTVRLFFDIAFDGKVADIVPDVKRHNALEGFLFPFNYTGMYSHMFLDNTKKTIPPQSIYDIQLAHRLGFQFIEANVHATATTGKYVVTHGDAGKLGGDFETVNGEDASTVVIADTSFDDLRTLYRYKSDYVKYKTPITSLEEFLYQCKSLNMFPVLGYVDDTELQVAKNIMGNNMILYGGSRSKFDGFIMEYNGETSKAAIVSRCQTVGKPYMYCMSNPNSFSDAELKEIIASVHDIGCYIGSAGVYLAPDKNVRLRNLGFDFTASGDMVPDFEYGNLLNICDDLSFDGITTNGTVVDNSLVLANGNSFSISNVDTSLVKKYIIDITFNGTLSCEIPRYTNPLATRTVTLTSDGRQSVRLSGVKMVNAFSATFTASGSVTVYNLVCKLSKC